MGKRIVIALGGNALGNNLPEQMIAVKKTASAIVDLIEAGNEVVIAHGNGPQVGMIQNAMSELTRSNPEKYIPCPLSVCVAMSQGYIGYDLQNALREEMLDRGINTGCTTILTQVEVDANDPAFENPTKPIGAFMTKEEADKLVKEKGYKVVEDAGRGYRRVVASPKPKSIIEIDTIRSLVENDYVVVACGGGGIPVFVSGGHHLKGAAAVIDKDFAAEAGRTVRRRLPDHFNRSREGCCSLRQTGSGVAVRAYPGDCTEVYRGWRVRTGLHASEGTGSSCFRRVRTGP